jgi:hypothetical protein
MIIYFTLLFYNDFFKKKFGFKKVFQCGIKVISVFMEFVFKKYCVLNCLLMVFREISFLVLKPFLILLLFFTKFFYKSV